MGRFDANPTTANGEDMRNRTGTPSTEISVRRKVRDGWYVYTCDLLPGLYVAHADDRVAYNDLPNSIATLVKLNFGVDCTVAHKVSYHEFVRACGLDGPRGTVEKRTQDLIDDHADQYFEFILQQAPHLNQ